MKLKIVLLSLVTLFIAGCDEMEGELNVSKSFRVNGRSGQEKIETGVYKTALDFKRGRVVAEIQRPSGKVKVDFNVPDNSSLPDNGNFELRSAQTGQSVDIVGNVKTNESKSAMQSGYENCQYQDFDPVCGQNGCITRPVQRWGRQYAEFYFIDTDKNIQFFMNDVGSTKHNAKFTGVSRVSQKVIVRQGQCF